MSNEYLGLVRAVSTLVSNSLKKDLDMPKLLEQEYVEWIESAICVGLRIIVLTVGLVSMQEPAVHSIEEGYHMMVCGHAARYGCVLTSACEFAVF